MNKKSKKKRSMDLEIREISEPFQLKLRCRGAVVRGKRRCRDSNPGAGLTRQTHFECAAL